MPSPRITRLSRGQPQAGHRLRARLARLVPRRPRRGCRAGDAGQLRPAVRAGSRASRGQLPIHGRLRGRRAGARRAEDRVRRTRMPPPIPAGDPRGRAGEGHPGRSPAHGRPGQRGLGDLRRDRRRITGRIAQGPPRWRPGPSQADRPRYRRRGGLRAQARGEAQAASRRGHRRNRGATRGDCRRGGLPFGRSPVVPDGWTTRYAARRIAWHVLEHGREMQDRAQS